MITIKANNVNEVYSIGINLLLNQGVKQASQHGDTLEIDQPVSVCYKDPRQRVLFNKQRDINPFLHFFEPLWILAGREDVDFLQYLVPNMAKYSDNGSTYYGAYGRRMRGLPGMGDDQIQKAIERLQKDPDSRQVVINIRDRNDLWYEGKDTPCNLMVMLKVRQGRLNMHVINRSNDFIWGLTGTNVCQFSMLQEYIADKLGVALGHYHQTTDSFHCYLNQQWVDIVKHRDFQDPYAEDGVRAFPMGCADPHWDEDLAEFFFRWDTGHETTHYKSAFFCDVVDPMWNTFNSHVTWRKNKLEPQREATKHYASDILADDWRLVTMQWLEKRWDNAKEKA